MCTTARRRAPIGRPVPSSDERQGDARRMASRPRPIGRDGRRGGAGRRRAPDDRVERLAQAERRSRAMVSNTGWMSVGELEMTRRISLVAVCCSEVSVRSRLRASSSLNRRTFSIGDHGLVGEGLQQLDPRSVNGRAVGACDDDRCRREAVAEHGHRQAAAKPASLAAPQLRSWGRRGRRRCGPGRRARSARRPTVSSSAPAGTRARRASMPLGRDVVEGYAGGSGRRRTVKTLTLMRRRRAARRVARDGVEHGLDVGRRARDDAQDLAGRRLLLQGLGEVAITGLQLREEAHVLDGDDGLVGEGLEEGDLGAGERARRRPTVDDDEADG